MRSTWLVPICLLGCGGPDPKPADPVDPTGTDETAHTGDTGRDTTPPPVVDADQDGFAADVDCDDADATVHPGAPETCDGRDEDCDGDVDLDDPDLDPSLLVLGYADADGDGWGADGTPTPVCPPAVTRAGDCDDGEATVNPDAVDLCEDGVDANCTGADPLCHPSLVSQDLVTSTYPRFDGWLGGQQAGLTVDVPGDIDGDRVADLVIGARTSASGPSGPVMVVHGGNLVSESLETAADVTVYGPRNDNVGWAAHGAGDVDGDGLVDLVLGAPFVDSRAAVFTAPAGALDFDDDATARWFGVLPADATGKEVTGGADLTGDGVLDLVVTSDQFVPPDALSMVHLLDATLTGDHTIDAYTSRIVDFENASGFGLRSDVGDVTGDGVADLVVGASSADPGGLSTAGELFLFAGPVPSGQLDAHTAAAFVAQGAADGWKLGYDVAVGGDLDGDGVADVIGVAREAVFDTAGLGTEGHVYVFAGSLLGTVTTDDATASWVGEQPDGDVLRAVGADFDGDAVSDLALAALDGEVHVVFGPLSGRLGPADGLVLGVPEFLDGELATGDLDADGYDDLVIGSANADPYGITWVVWGAP